MDPDATFQELLEAVENGDRGRVSELIAVLESWMSRGGFPPLTIGQRRLGLQWHVSVAKAVLRVAEVQVREIARQLGRE